MADSNRPSMRSAALEANLRETAATVEIPREMTPLLEAAKPHFGLYQDLEALLKEYFHPYRNTSLLVDGLARQVLGRWFQYESKANRAVLFSLFTRLIQTLVPFLRKSDREEALRVLLAFWGEALGGKFAEEYEPLIREWLHALPSTELPAALFVRRDNQIEAIAPRFLKSPALSDEYLRMCRIVLLEGLRLARERLDMAAWAEDNPGVIEDIARCREAFAQLTAKRISAYEQQLSESAPGTAESIGKLPNLSRLVAMAIKGLNDLTHTPDRFQAAMFLLKDDITGPRQNEIVSILLDVLDQLLKKGNEDQIERIIYQLTSFLKSRPDFYPEVRFTIYSRMGIAIGRENNERLAGVLMTNLMSWPFEEPQVQGTTAEWKVRVNPWHVANIRCLLGIITSNPPLYRKLIASLTLFLRLGKVFVPDTALLQKDITALLAADIGPAYHQVRQLCASLPVFFNELGAEGELRDLSTEIDQATERRDSIIHFLRKAVHAETNNLLVKFSEEVLNFWVTGKYEELKSFLPPELVRKPVEEGSLSEEPRAILAKLTADIAMEDLLRCTKEEVRSHVDAVKAGFSAMNVERVFCLVRVVQLLRDKYSFDNGSLSAKLDGNLRIPKPLRDTFATASESGNDYLLLDTTLDILEHLKLTILSGGETAPQENIYYKRHVAAGIPSMYGEYREPRFDALGLSFRVERLTCRLFGRMADQVKGDYISKEFLWSVTNALQKFRRALDVDGLLKDSYSLGVELLQKCLDSYRINYYQFRNIIKQFIAPAVHGLVEGPVFGEYAEAAVRIHRNKLLAVVPKESFGPNATAEVAVREMLATSVALQELDAFVTRICNVADEMARKLDPDRLSRILNFRAQRLVTFIHEDLDALSDPMHLGSKGFSLKRMARFGFKVPPGFIISTELYSIREALTFDPVAKDIRARLYAAFDRLEKESGKRFGDPANLLMLSVRSSGTNSMPGMMATFLNVGLNDAIVEELSHESNYGWTSWDCYRRFLQCWGMSEGIDRDDFDSIISKFKEKYNVKVKIEFSGAIMREIAYAYKNLLTERGFSIPEDPREQVLAVVYKVLSSWDNASAKVYRRQMDIAEDWGTAVVVQQMVLGNINYDSGTGVMFTHPPSSRGLNIQLEGEYVFCSQGEDVVAGLVFPYPLSEWQRREQKIHRNASGSLETHLPGIYSKLLEVSRDMVLGRSFEHQEIEFTFETSSAKDLYILQTRPMVFDDEKRRKLFEDPDSIWSDWLAAGLGSGGGAFTGRVAIGETDIQMVSSLYTGDPLLLVRPDTVPDDIHLIVTAEALLTARGGGTSHAAITAKRLGKVCVVNCPRMEVDETRSEVRFGDRIFRPGDWLSINGDTGDIFAGKHPVR